MQMTARDWLMLIILSILWGGAFFFAAIAVKQLPPLTLVFCRVSIAAIALLIFLLIKGENIPRSPAIWGAFLMMGFLNNLIPFSLLFWAQTNISSGLASIINATTPIFSILVAHFILADEKLTVNKLIGVVLGFVGVAILLGGAAFNTSNLAILSIVACLVAALSYGCAGVFGRRFKQMGISPNLGAFGQLSGATILMLPLIFVFDKPWALPAPNLTVIFCVLTLAIMSTAVAYLIFFRLLANVGAVNVMLVTLLVPVSAILLGSLILAEQLESRHYIGMAFILTGLLAVDGRLFRKLKN